MLPTLPLTAPRESRSENAEMEKERENVNGIDGIGEASVQRQLPIRLAPAKQDDRIAPPVAGHEKKTLTRMSMSS